MFMNDDEIIAKATAQAKAMKKKLAKRMIDHLPEEESAVSVFMAGSPGVQEKLKRQKVLFLNLNESMILKLFISKMMN